MRLRLAMAAILAAGASGCLANLPPDRDPVHLQVHWRESAKSACEEATRTGRPMLFLMIGGDLTERC
ncbi:MAG TPA: hypothetical protein VK661_02850 [Planctomycetota bacterium]|jgi:hypothetical protein|nr:hypothetical protein [Planctomycetota bacterium]